MTLARAASTVALAALGACLSLAAAAPARALVSCDDLARAPRAPADDAAAARATEVWQGVARVAAALTGLDAELRVLAAGARMADGQRFPPNAVTCPEAAGVVVYLTDTLVDSVLSEQRYPVDFLAFVLGHELGHRMNDLDAAGRPLPKPKGVTADREVLADMRGAYLASAAGFSARRLACEDCLNHYLDAEAKLAPEPRLARQKGLNGLLADFEVWESLYDAGVALAFSGFPAEAKRVLAWAESETKRQAVPVPELQVLHALVLMMGAAESAPWLAATKVPAEALAHLRCTPIYPAHSTLWEDVAPLTGARGGADVAAARQDLQQARRLLESAAELGASELVVASAEACVDTYLGQTREAGQALARARKALKKGAPPELAQALAANEALVELVALTKGALIADGDQAGWKALLDALGKARAKLDQSPAVARVARGLAKVGPGRLPPPADEPPAGGACPAAATPATAADVLPTLPRAGAAGACPCGWIPAGTLAGASASPDAPPAVTMCVPAGWGSELRRMAIHLPATNAGPRVDVDLLLVDRVPDRLTALDTWTRRCDAVEARGLSDRAEPVFAAACPALGLETGVLFGSSRCEVARAVVLELGR